MKIEKVIKITQKILIGIVGIGILLQFLTGKGGFLFYLATFPLLVAIILEYYIRYVKKKDKVDKIHIEKKITSPRALNNDLLIEKTTKSKKMSFLT